MFEEFDEDLKKWVKKDNNECQYIAVIISVFAASFILIGAFIGWYFS